MKPAVIKVTGELVEGKICEGETWVTYSMHPEQTTGNSEFYNLSLKIKIEGMSVAGQDIEQVLREEN